MSTEAPSSAGVDTLGWLPDGLLLCPSEHAEAWQQTELFPGGGPLGASRVVGYSVKEGSLEAPVATVGSTGTVSATVLLDTEAAGLPEGFALSLSSDDESVVRPVAHAAASAAAVPLSTVRGVSLSGSYDALSAGSATLSASISFWGIPILEAGDVEVTVADSVPVPSPDPDLGPEPDPDASLDADHPTRRGSLPATGDSVTPALVLGVVVVFGAACWAVALSRRHRASC